MIDMCGSNYNYNIIFKSGKLYNRVYYNYNNDVYM